MLTRAKCNLSQPKQLGPRNTISVVTHTIKSIEPRLGPCMNWVTRCLTQTKVVNLVLTFNLRHSHIPIHTQTPSRRLLAQAAHVWSERVTPRSQSRTVGIPQTQALTGALLNESRYSVMARITLTAKLLQNNPFMGRHTSKNNCETPKRTFGFVRPLKMFVVPPVLARLLPSFDHLRMRAGSATRRRPHRRPAKPIFAAELRATMA